MSLVFLIGMPGAGKSYRAKLLSGKYGYQFADIDEYIEIQEGKTINEIFNTGGESYFREVEAACLKGIIEENTGNRMIVACGGGTPAYGNNMELMKQHGCVVYLKADLNVLAERIKNEAAKRPMFSSDDSIEATLEKLYEKRRAYYEQADYTVDANEHSITDFDKIMTLCTNRQ